MQKSLSSRMQQWSLLGLTLLLSLSLQANPEHLVFTYQGDPATSLTANWQVIDDTKATGAATVHYDTVSRVGKADAYAHSATGNVTTIEGLDDRHIYQTKLDGLQAGTTYYLIVGNDDTGYSQEVKVRTIADDDSALRFVTGGDMGTSEDTRNLLRNAATYAPHFAVVGGDTAYANGKLSNVGSWDKWLQYYTEEMITPDGYQIPLILAIGNHEVMGSYDQPKSHAPFYFGLFAQEEDRSYFTVPFKPHFVLIVLDTGHVATHESQVDWLREQLEAYQSVTHRAAVYHVPLYPSHRGLMDRYSTLGRKFWAPLFDEYGLTVAFENHDHTFKRSYLMKDGEPTTDGTGTLYLGDGCWGREPRGIDFHGRDYLAIAGSIQHFWLVDVTPEQMQYQAIDLQNQVFDVYPRDLPNAKAADAVYAQKVQNYYLPGDMVKISDMACDTPTWFAGQTEVTLTNTFDFPIVIDLLPRFPSNLKVKQSEELKDIALQPGATVVIPIDISTTSEDGYQADKVNFYLRIEMHSAPSHGEPTVHFENTYGIKAKPAAR